MEVFTKIGVSVGRLELGIDVVGVGDGSTLEADGRVILGIIESIGVGSTSSCEVSVGAGVGVGRAELGIWFFNPRNFLRDDKRRLLVADLACWRWDM